MEARDRDTLKARIVFDLKRRHAYHPTGVELDALTDKIAGNAWDAADVRAIAAHLADDPDAPVRWKVRDHSISLEASDGHGIRLEQQIGRFLHEHAPDKAFTAEEEGRWPPE